MYSRIRIRVVVVGPSLALHCRSSAPRRRCRFQNHTRMHETTHIHRRRHRCAHRRWRSSLQRPTRTLHTPHSIYRPTLREISHCSERLSEVCWGESAAVRTAVRFGAAARSRGRGMERVELNATGGRRLGSPGVQREVQQRLKATGFAAASPASSSGSSSTSRKRRTKDDIARIAREKRDVERCETEAIRGSGRDACELGSSV